MGDKCPDEGKEGGTRGIQRRDCGGNGVRFLEKVTCRMRFENETGTNLLKKRKGNDITGSRENGIQRELEVQQKLL